MKKTSTAVVFHSWSGDGNTRFAAETIAKAAEADLFEIKPESPYPSNYSKCCDEAKPECYSKALRPIKPIEGFDPAAYDVIFVGTPNWWGTMSPPVRSWVSANAAALKGKTLALFQTNGGGGLQRAGREFAEMLPESRILDPRAFPGASVRQSQAALEAFVFERLDGEQA